MSNRDVPGVQPIRLAIWTALSLAFVVGLYFSARAGIRHAEERVPKGSIVSPTAHKLGVDIEVEGDFVFAATQQELREYYFREETTAGTGMLEKGNTADVFEFSGSMKLHTVKMDIDLIFVEIVEGPRADDRFWMRAKLLSRSKNQESSP